MKFNLAVLFVIFAFGVTGSLSFALGKKSVRASCPPKPPTVPELDISRVNINYELMKL
jgi:hypothetical protein